MKLIILIGILLTSCRAYPLPDGTTAECVLIGSRCLSAGSLAGIAVWVAMILALLGSLVVCVMKNKS